MPMTLEEESADKGQEVSVLHHLRINVADLSRTRAFYEPILSWLGFRDIGAHYGQFGELERLRYAKGGFILLFSRASHAGAYELTKVGLHHLAFSVSTREDVNRFYHEILLQLPGIDIQDPPVDCPEYREGYYATFFYDPDGIKLEVTYTP